MGLAIHGKNYVVAVPIPSLDKNGRGLDPELKKKWEEKVQEELAECFGGAIPSIPLAEYSFCGTSKLGKSSGISRKGRSL